MGPFFAAIGSALSSVGSAIGSIGATTATTTAATAATTSGTLFTAANMQMIGTGLSAVSSIYQGQQQAEAYRLQSQQAALKGRQDALQYNQRAFQTLQANDRLRSALIARAAAGGVDPFTGSPMSLSQANDMAAYEEARIDRENAQMALYGGLGQSQALQAAASTAETYGLLKGAADAAMGGVRFMDTKTPGVLA